MSRRELIKRSITVGIVGMGMSTASSPLMAASGLLLPQNYANSSDAAAFWAKPRTLNLFRPSSGEHQVVCFWRDGRLDLKGYLEACKLLRDVTANKTVQIDLRLLNLLRGQQGWLEMAMGLKEPYQINSGYRSEETNALTEGAAKDSLHKKGQACDGKYPSLPIEYQGKLMSAFRTGGVGFYINRQKFIHSDVGRIRYWVR